MNYEKLPFEIVTVNSRDLLIPESYQRRLKKQRVSRIVANFDERIANEPKVSLRDGKFYIYDGEHTVAARIMRNGGKDLPIRCKVYRGLTESEEALLFAAQTGESAPLTPSAKIRAEIYGGKPVAVAYLQATEAVGLHLGFGQTRGKDRIICINTAFHEFVRVGPECYMQALEIVKEAWDGHPDSLRAESLQGVIGFVELYLGEYNKERLISRLHAVDPITIYRSGMADTSICGVKRFIHQVYRLYNGNSKKRLLPLKF